MRYRIDRHWVLSHWWLLSMAALACSGEAERKGETKPTPERLSVGIPGVFDEDVAQKVAPEVLEAISRGESLDVIVVLDDGPNQARTERGSKKLNKKQRASHLAQRAEELGKLKSRMLENLIGGDLDVVHEYTHMPVLAMRVSSPEALATLVAAGEVKSVWPNQRRQKHLTESNALIGGAPAGGVSAGTGATVAILDTGADYTHAALGTCTAPSTCGHGVCTTGDALDSACEACVATVCGTTPSCCDTVAGSWDASCVTAAETACSITCPDTLGDPYVPLGAGCKVVYSRDFATEDSSADADGHGTIMAAVALGVAPAAEIISLDVFDGTTAADADIISAMDWVVTNQATYNIVAINLALGDGSYAEACDTDGLAAAIGTARDAGILTVVSSGNDRRTSAINAPACVTDALSVGAVYDANEGSVSLTGCTDATTAADKVLCNSNSASILDMLAPGAVITAAGSDSGGTSLAAAHVSGAVAILADLYDTETADDWESRLLLGGDRVADARNGIVKPRLNIATSAAACVYGVTPVAASFDWDGTTYGGDATLTVSTVPNTCTWSASVPLGGEWVTINSPASFPATGSQTLSYDVAVPTQQEIDDLLGADRVVDLDVAGESIRITQNELLGPPRGSFVINTDAQYTITSAVTLDLSSVNDGTTVAEMCISNTSTCTSFQSYVASKTWNLGSTNGLRTVYVTFRDDNGNANATPFTDTITLDTVAPVNGTLTGVVDGNGDTFCTSGEIALQWQNFSDATSGVDQYKLVFGTSSTPSSCNSGTVVDTYEETTTTDTHTGRSNGVPYYYRLCAKDNAGKWSTGATVVGYARPECDAPTACTVAINSGATVTTASSVTLALSATDASAPVSYCTSTRNTGCTSFSTATSKSLTLPTGAGTKTVYAWCRDTYRNQAGPVSSTIVRDLTTLTGTPGDQTCALTWASSALTGFSEYKVAYNTTALPTACGDSDTTVANDQFSTTVSSLTNGALYYIRVCGKVGTAYTTGVTTTCRPRPESLAPEGTVSIAAAATWTSTRDVTLTLTANEVTTAGDVAIDVDNPVDMCVTNTTTCTAWEDFNTSKAWQLAIGDGTKTVRVFLRDQWYNTTTLTATPYDTIGLDTRAPAAGTITATPTDASLSLTWTGQADPGAGGVEYKLLRVAGTTAPASCTDAAATTVQDWGTTTAVTDTPLSNCTQYSYRLCARDSLGNTNTGATKTGTPRDEETAPTPGATPVEINDGAEYTNAATVTLALAATDATALGAVCISNTTTCTNWQAWDGDAVDTFSWTLTSGNGLKTIYVKFRDTCWNETTTASTGTITRDGTRPANPTTFDLTAGNGTVNLSWGGGTDTGGSDVAAYKLAFKTGTSAPTSCSPTGTGGTVLGTFDPVADGTDYDHGGAAPGTLTNGTQHCYRICTVDGAGNLSTGATACATPKSETEAPTGMATAATYSKSSTIPLTLTATDGPMGTASGVAAVCSSNVATSCTSWTTVSPAVASYSGTKNHVLSPTTNGLRTIYVSFRDAMGNVNDPPAEVTTTFDNVKPVDGTVGVTAAGTTMTITWSGFADATSLIAQYKVVYTTTTSFPGTGCSTGTAVTGSPFASTVSSTTNVGISGRTYRYRVCAIDNAGNTSTGTTYAFTP